jgi:hypothetical protein
MRADADIESLLARLAEQPDNLTIHEELHRAALRYKAAGGAPLEALSAIPPMSRDALRALIHFERCWAYDVGNSDLLIRVAHAIDANAAAHPDSNFGPVLRWLNELLRSMLRAG